MGGSENYHDLVPDKVSNCSIDTSEQHQSSQLVVVVSSKCYTQPKMWCYTMKTAVQIATCVKENRIVGLESDDSHWPQYVSKMG